jgi:hypothetical protein
MSHDNKKKRDTPNRGGRSVSRPTHFSFVLSPEFRPLKKERDLIVGPPGNPVFTRLRAPEKGKGKGACVILLEAPVPK